MKLLTVGIGTRGAKIVEMFSKRGPKVNRVPLFKTFVILNSVDALKSISLNEDEKFFVVNDPTGAVTKITGLHEISEGNLVILSLEDDFAYEISLEVVKMLKKITGDYTVVAALVPKVYESDVIEIKEKIKNIRDVCDVLFLFSGTLGIDDFILKSFSLLALAGEVDLRKREAGEVVIDTSDIFNSLIYEGFSVIGYAERKVFRGLFKDKSELKAIRTRRMIELIDSATKNLSVEAEIKDAKSALILYASRPEEITMEGIFSAISKIESLNDHIIVRYGDYPMKTNKIHLVLLFSGIRKLL